MKTVLFGFALAETLCLLCSTCPAASENASGGLIFQDRFLGRLADGWLLEREEDANWRVGPLGLEVRAQPGNMWGPANNAKNVFVHPIPAPTDQPIEISATISNRPTAQWEQADLVWYYDGGNMVKLGQELVTGRYSVVMGREEGDRARTIAIVPLDANSVELRLQALDRRIRGQFRTAVWREWRDVGECNLPVKGQPKASLQFYNGPPNLAHWVRVSQFAVRRLSSGSVDWPRERLEVKTCRSADNPRAGLITMPLPEGYSLASDVESIVSESRANYEQTIYRYKDKTFGWHWNRQNTASKEPTLAGVQWGTAAKETMVASDSFPSISIDQIKSCEMNLDAVTWLEDDRGDHNFAVVLWMRPAGRVTIGFDWYGPASHARSLSDGYRDYGYFPTSQGSSAPQYRIQGFRGAPPRVNLQAFLDDAVRRGLPAGSQLSGIWVGNEIWNGSRGGTLMTRLEVVMNGKRYEAAP